MPFPFFLFLFVSFSFFFPFSSFVHSYVGEFDLLLLASLVPRCRRRVPSPTHPPPRLRVLYLTQLIRRGSGSSIVAHLLSRCRFRAALPYLVADVHDMFHLLHHPAADRLSVFCLERHVGILSGTRHYGAMSRVYIERSTPSSILVNALECQQSR
ncbi:hypothetical protein EXIGLDRAFT_291171 [Exidia glandulosa HHB12029]|uniref:Uncharacterized protein n=1 Tax=Exidia glandulosa HHB12029 TaxID=1314781 RepID=A0A165DEM8_EXIGL|nr:hypothetical protein EXIGLDRAFT_291171 [Exidia glandulosa HHB12029]